ncbi:MAG: NADH-quinone oxidoreductase subunit J [Verrucomicrobiae bacterium]|nr:NADH-quinone oxidoreductase subunit J [Verrucomicrobiae bacterium]
MLGEGAAELSIAALFWFFVVLAAGGALIAVLTTRVIRSVCGLAICCLGLAGLYYYLHSPFLALMEVLIYIGAVCVTIVFAIMLAEPDEPPPAPRTRATWVWAMLMLVPAFGVFLLLSHLSLAGPWPALGETRADDSLKAVGLALLTKYCLAFELISLVLLAAILGALVVAREGRTREH